MFDRLVESTHERRSARTWTLFAVSTVIWSVIFSGVVVAGVMLADARLDANFDRLEALVPVAPSASPAPQARKTEPAKADDAGSNRNLVAIAKPNEAIAPPGPPVPFSGPILPGAIDGGDPMATGPGEPDGQSDFDGGRTNGGAAIPVPAPPQPPAIAEAQHAPPAPPRPRHIGIITGLATRRVEPPYPELAKAIGVQGAVVVSVTVSETGQVLDASALSGHPALRQASIDAAKRWRFSPTMLNGIPIKVIGTITFNFKRT